MAENGKELATREAGPAAITTATVAQQNSLVREMAERYGVEPKKFMGVVRDTLMPPAKPEKNEPPVTDSEIAVFLMVAKEYNLNPFVRELYAFRGRNGGIVPIVPIDGWVTIINRQKMLDGIEFEDLVDKDGKITAIRCTIYRKDRTRPITCVEYMAECKRTTDPWTQWPKRMLRHKALIQCARYAFGLAGIFDPDEADRIIDATPDRRVRTIGGDPDLANEAPEHSADEPQAPERVIEETVRRIGADLGMNTAEINMRIGQAKSLADLEVELVAELKAKKAGAQAQQQSTEPTQEESSTGKADTSNEAQAASAKAGAPSPSLFGQEKKEKAGRRGF
jgi:phage recombination protein Bet